MAHPCPTVLDATKLFNNALTSIRLGIEDFELSQKVRENGGDPARALSAYGTSLLACCCFSNLSWLPVPLTLPQQLSSYLCRLKSILKVTVREA
ncbi:hypothetical protein [Pseudomonas asiatica]|uniref:hypothetical protein n=1 Tax=Pseudomonas asiatica TaxID=2219225 RepID=UPI001CD66172|nr:hypothetical protein [Pseudomonas asiatica]